MSTKLQPGQWNPQTLIRVQGTPADTHIDMEIRRLHQQHQVEQNIKKVRPNLA